MSPKTGLLSLVLFLIPSVALAESAHPVLGFDELAEATVLDKQYVKHGVQFTSGGAKGPAVFGVFGSPASFRNFLVGEHEGTEDKNDTSEYGNGKPAVSIGMTFVTPNGPGVTTRVAMKIIYLNVGSTATVRAYGVDGAVVAESVVEGKLGAFSQPVEVKAEGIARVEVSFGRPDGIEDNAGIDDLFFHPVTAAPE